MTAHMKSILSPAEHRTLDRWLRDETLFAFDYDGTLAPITCQPSEACMAPRTAMALARLSALSPVAVISGRARHDLLGRLPVALAYVIGNHGNEGLPVNNESSSVSQEQCCKDWLKQLQALHMNSADRGALAGLFTEDKGTTLTLHYRQCGNPSLVQAILLDWVSLINPTPQVIHGHLCINLLPPGSQNKRHALIQLMAHSGCQRAVYVGDDATDELVFMDAPSQWLTVYVGERHDSHARYRLASVQEVTRLIERAVTAHEALRGRLSSG